MTAREQRVLLPLIPTRTMSTTLLSVLENLESITGNMERAVAPDDLVLEELGSMALALENLDSIMRRLRQVKNHAHSHWNKLLALNRTMDMKRMVTLMPFCAHGVDGTMSLYTQDAVQANSFFQTYLNSW